MWKQINQTCKIYRAQNFKIITENQNNYNNCYQIYIENKFNKVTTWNNHGGEPHQRDSIGRRVQLSSTSYQTVSKHTFFETTGILLLTETQRISSKSIEIEWSSYPKSSSCLPRKILSKLNPFPSKTTRILYFHSWARESAHSFSSAYFARIARGDAPVLPVDGIFDSSPKKPKQKQKKTW